MNKAVVVLTLATFSFGSASAYLVRELRSEREQAQALQAQLEELQRAPPPIKNPFDAPAPVAAPPPPLAEPPRPAPAPAPAMTREPVAAMEPQGPGFAPARLAMMERSRQLLQDPEYRKAMLAQQKFSMTRMYPDLHSALRLQPAEADRLLELLAEQQMNQMSSSPPLAAPGQRPDPQQIQQYQEQLQQMQREREAQIASLLGDSKLQEWQKYQKTLGARMQVRELRTTLAESGIPLREGQLEPLVEAIATEQERRNQEMMKNQAQLTAMSGVNPSNRISMIEQNLDVTAEYNQRLHDAAAPYLSSDQLRYFDQHLNQQLEMQRAGLRLMRAQAEAAARGDLPEQNHMIGVAPAQALISSQSFAVQ